MVSERGSCKELKKANQVHGVLVRGLVLLFFFEFGSKSLQVAQSKSARVHCVRLRCPLQCGQRAIYATGPILEVQVLRTHSKKGHVFVVRPLFYRLVKSCRRNCIVCLCVGILGVTQSSLFPVDAKLSLGSDCVVKYHFPQFCRFALVRLKLYFLQ